MKYLLSAPMMALVAACSSCAHGGLQDRPVTNPDLAPTVKIMHTNDDGETRFHCTGWKVGDGLVATAGHCCDKGETYTLAGPNAEPGAEAHVLVDLGGDDDDPYENDVCIMRGQVRGPAIQLARQDPAVGAHVWTVGYPEGNFLISEGIWSGRNDHNLGVASQTAHPGASGSPVLDAQGRAIGIAVRYWTSMDNIEFVAPLEKLRFALRKARLKKDEPDDLEFDIPDIKFPKVD